MTLGLLGKVEKDCDSFVSDRRLSEDCSFCITLGNSSGVYIGISSSLKKPVKPSASGSTTSTDVSDKTGSGVAGRVVGFLPEKASSKMRSNSSQEMIGLSREDRNMVGKIWREYRVCTRWWYAATIGRRFRYLRRCRVITPLPRGPVQTSARLWRACRRMTVCIRRVSGKMQTRNRCHIWVQVQHPYTSLF